jgi:hypothetical protein
MVFSTHHCSPAQDWKEIVIHKPWRLVDWVWDVRAKRAGFVPTHSAREDSAPCRDRINP